MRVNNLRLQLTNHLFDSFHNIQQIDAVKAVVWKNMQKTPPESLLPPHSPTYSCAAPPLKPWSHSPCDHCGRSVPPQNNGIHLIALRDMSGHCPAHTENLVVWMLQPLPTLFSSVHTLLLILYYFILFCSFCLTLSCGGKPRALRAHRQTGTPCQTPAGTRQTP